MSRQPLSPTTLLLAVLLGGVASPALAASPTVLVMPFTGKKALVGDLGHAVQLRALGTVLAMDGVSVIHPKQLNRVAQHHEHRLMTLAKEERNRELGTVLGADWIISGTVERRTGTVEITFEVRSLEGKTAKTASVKGESLMQALAPFPGELVGALKALSAVQGEPPAADMVTPVTSSEDALVDFAGCHRIMIEQPIGIRTPTLLNVRRIDSAIRHCRDALGHDKSLEAAKAALGFLYALRGDRRLSERHLAAVKKSKRFHPEYWIGKFWVVSRHHNVDAAVNTLEAAIQVKPGFLLARGYLGDSLVALKRYDKAKAIFEKYLEVVPKQPWVMGRIGYVSSKLGDTDGAITWTKKALRIAPSDSELLLEMASRYVDAQKLDEAITILQRLVAEGRARGEVHLRLGYAYLKKGQIPKAEHALHAAIRAATAISEWRTRGRARYDLAKMWMQSGVPGNALRQLRMAVEEGYRDKEAFENDPDFKPLRANAEFKRLMRGPAKRNKDLPKYSSPFKLDPETGSIDVRASTKSRRKKQTVILRF